MGFSLGGLEPGGASAADAAGDPYPAVVSEVRDPLPSQEAPAPVVDLIRHRRMPGPPVPVTVLAVAQAWWEMNRVQTRGSIWGTQRLFW